MILFGSFGYRQQHYRGQYGHHLRYHLVTAALPDRAPDPQVRPLNMARPKRPDRPPRQGGASRTPGNPRNRAMIRPLAGQLSRHRLLARISDDGSQWRGEDTQVNLGLAPTDATRR